MKKGLAYGIILMFILTLVSPLTMGFNRISVEKDEMDSYDEIDSIDEAANVYKQSLLGSRIVEGPVAMPSQFQNETITPEEEFWGHCSNLQTWVEHNYDTNILDDNLAFPLLKKF